MFVEVQKTADRPIIVAVRSDGVRLRVRAPDRKFSPPHDLIHFVVEKSMCLQRGFWGSIADGAKFDSIEVIDGRQKPRASERSTQVITANKSCLSEAEAIVGAFQTVLHEDLRPHQEVLMRLLRTAGKTFEAEVLRATWRELLSFRERWTALPLATVMRLEWHGAGGSKNRR